MYKVLIADDEPKVIQLINALIDWNKLGLELVATVRDGITALEQIKKLEPDIVITDIRMPGHDGIELIKQTRALGLDVDFIIISGYQHFDYAHTAIKYDVKDYLLKPLKQDEINDVLKKMVTRYNEESDRMVVHTRILEQSIEDRKLIKETFTGKLFEDSSDLESLDEHDVHRAYHLKFDRNQYRIICIKPDIKFKVGSEDVLNLLLKKTHDVVDRILMPYVGEILYYELFGYLYILINYDKEDYKHIRNGLLLIINEVHALRDLFKNVTVTVGMSNEFNRLEDFSIHYEVTKLRIYDKILSSTSRIIDTDMHANQIEVSDYFTKDDKSHFINIIRELNVKQFEKEGKNWVSTICLSRDISGAAYFLLAEQMLHLVTETLLRFELIDKEIIYSRPLANTELHMEKTIVSLFDKTIDYCCELLSIGLETRKKNNSMPVHDAINYINCNFSQALSLEIVSSEVGFNASYFSTLFKRETGKNFLEYLTSVRMEQAKRYLSEGKVKIGEIGDLCGYHDNKHFSKQFKKYTGLSPSQYKKLYF